MIWKNGNIINGSLQSYPIASESGWIYEVIRVIDNTPVFLIDHLSRLRVAALNTDSKIPFSDQELFQAFFDVITANNAENENIRLQTEIGTGRTLIGIIPHHYPSDKDYQNGVATDLVYVQRNDPNIKIWNESVRKFSDEYIRNNDVYEVILTSDEGFLNEGSRSNIFGFQKGILKTPPVKDVLPGITRQKIIEIALYNNIPVMEEPIHKEEIYSFHSFFLTGTSPGVLPLSRIGNFHFNCKSLTCEKIRQAYKQEIDKSINQAKHL